MTARMVAIPDPARVPPPTCAECGHDMFVGDYCGACGHQRGEPDREAVSLGGIQVISDRGCVHPCNDDAAAAGMVGDDVYAVAVCDGVSNSPEPRTAAIAASTAGVTAMLSAVAAGQSPQEAVLAGLAAAACAATATGGPRRAPSCTYAAAVVAPGVQIAVANIGDSRVYWLPSPPAQPQCLTVDDSVAQQLILAGIPAEAPEVAMGAHMLTRWLGADADPKPWTDVCTLTTAGSGVLLLCTDGLWNYLPEPEDLARFDGPAALVDYALRSGGQDNITVAVVPIGGTS